MIEIPFYEKKTLKLEGYRLLALDAKYRKEFEYGDDDCVLIHELLLYASGEPDLHRRLPDPQSIVPDDECGPPSKSHLGYTRQELIAWVAQKQREQMEGVPDIFEDLDKE